MKTIVGLFDKYSNADDAVQALQDHGVDNSFISVVTPEDGKGKHGSAVETGVVTGAATGGLVGLLAGLSAVIIPGIGPVIATGTIASALASALGMTVVGAGLGAATGGLLGALINLDFSKEDAKFYAEGVKRGGTLVSVEAESGDEEEVTEILRSAGAVDMDTRREAWQSQGWTSYDRSEDREEETETMYDEEDVEDLEDSEALYERIEDPEDESYRNKNKS